MVFLILDSLQLLNQLLQHFMVIIRKIVTTLERWTLQLNGRFHTRIFIRLNIRLRFFDCEKDAWIINCWNYSVLWTMRLLDEITSKSLIVLFLVDFIKTLEELWLRSRTHFQNAVSNLILFVQFRCYSTRWSWTALSFVILLLRNNLLFTCIFIVLNRTETLIFFSDPWKISVLLINHIDLLNQYGLFINRVLYS